MFTNLKNKLIDEVKASPQKFQQLAQAAQAAVSSASSTASESVSGSDNFFSITEEDTPQNSPFKNTQNDNKIKKNVILNSSQSAAATIPINNGTTVNSTASGSRTRKLSNSSIASDVSFRLPPYDSPTIHHLQSDLDISASEIEDNSNLTGNTRLDVISKEQLHDAYKKAINRYQKYRLRYTELVKRYRDLERDSTKAREVLVETQDKAIRRINELREQCNLEQQAKAHLEEALRMEMDDMQCKIKAYQTKLKLLGENPENILEQIQRNTAIQLVDAPPLIELDNPREVNETNSTNNEHILNTKINELENELLRKDKEVNELKSKLENSIKEIEEFKLREENNTILLAKNKKIIHSELENKESEVKKLKDNITEYEKKIEQFENEKILLHKQLNQIPDLQHEIKQLNDIKQELNAKIISTEHLLNEMLKDKDKQIENLKKSLDNEISTAKVEYEAKIQKLSVQNHELNKIIEKFNNEINELKKVKSQNDSSLNEKIEKLQNENHLLECKINDYEKKLKENEIHENELKIEYDKKIEECGSDFKKQIEYLKKELDDNKSIKNKYEQEIIGLKEKITTLEIQRDDAIQNKNSNNNEQIQILNDNINKKDAELINATEKLNKLTEDMEILITKNNENEKSYQNEIHELNLKLKNTEKCMKDNTDDKHKKIENENHKLKLQVNNILQEITRMKNEMDNVKQSHDELENEKHLLEIKFENMTKDNQNNIKLEELIKDYETDNTKLKQTLKQYSDKIHELQEIINQNDINYKQEKNSLNKLIKDNELNYDKLHLEYDSLNDSYKKLNEKMSQILDENSRLHNAKEIMEHEYRSLQDKLNADEKNINNITELNKCLKNDNEQLKTELNYLKINNQNLNEKIQSIENELQIKNDKRLNDKDKREKLLNELKQVKSDKEILENELKILKDDLIKRQNELKIFDNIQNENDLLKQKLIKYENDYDELKNTYEQTIRDNTAKLNKLNEEENLLKLKNQDLLKQNNAFEIEINNLLEKIKNENEDNYKKYKNDIEIEISTLKNELDNMNEENDKNKLVISDLTKELKQATKLLDKLQNAENDNEKLNEKIKQLEKELLERDSAAAIIKLSESGTSLSQQQKINQKHEIDNLREMNERLQNELEELKQRSLAQISNLNQEIDDAKFNTRQLIEKLNDFDKIKEQNKQLINEIEEMKNVSNNQNNNNNSNSNKYNNEKINVNDDNDASISLSSSSDQDVELIKQEKNNLETKLKKIMHEVQDVSNRNLFLEQKCENYLILEQSNERLKLANEKLSRQLDETLVSLQHNEGISANTEFEYLKNIMFQYLTGTVTGNNETLVKVIAAVLKFSPQQTQVAIEKEHQRHSLFGQINNLL